LRNRTIGALLVVIVGATPVTVPASLIAIIVPSPEMGERDVVVTGLDESTLRALTARSLSVKQWAEVLSVTVAPDDETPSPPAILGSYEVRDNGIAFTPRFPFDAGIDYVVTFHCTRVNEFTGAACAEEVVTTTFFFPPQPETPHAIVEAVYPSGDVLPANLLKFYIYFSQPMREGTAFGSVQVVDMDGQVVADVFVETTPELWGASMMRLTMICHPGRIKRGLEMHDQAGPPLRAGERYRLTVDASLKDAAGLPLAEPFEYEFTVGPADRSSPDVNDWVLVAPRAGTRDPLVVSLGEPLDHALATRLIAVQMPDGTRLSGSIELREAETVWLFHPTDGWAAGEYILGVHPTLEDLAGNRLDRLFDEEGETASESSSVVRLSFDIK